jgi:hypothetical protein
LSYGIGAYCTVDVEVGLEFPIKAVLLGLYAFIAFVDGEVEVRHQLTVCPRGVDAEVIVELCVSGHKVDDDAYAGYHQQCFEYGALFESWHFVCCLVGGYCLPAFFGGCSLNDLRFESTKKMRKKETWAFKIAVWCCFVGICARIFVLFKNFCTFASEFCGTIGN